MLHEIKMDKTARFSLQDCDSQIAKALMTAVNGDTLREVALTIGYNTETTRRYMKGETKLPAYFVRQIAVHYDCDARDLLSIPIDPQKINLKLITTDRLINELGRRMTMIENCAVAGIVVNSTDTRQNIR